MTPKLDLNLISQVFEEIVGGEHAADGPVFCRAAAESIAAITKPHCITPQNMYSLCYAAGCLAAYRLRLKLGYDPMPSFTAGDVKVGESRDGIETARALYEEAINSVRGLLKPSDGVFISVRG